VQLLIQAGATVDSKTKDRWTALHGAARGRHKAAVQLLHQSQGSIPTGRATGADMPPQVNGSADPQLQFGSAPARAGKAVNETDNSNQLPSIRFSPVLSI
jgi:ankyrin repeat protein